MPRKKSGQKKGELVLPVLLAVDPFLENNFSFLGGLLLRGVDHYLRECSI
jgi:hypothetical protein